jgi:diacylglycerol kinase
MKSKSLSRRIRAFGYAFQGLRTLWRSGIHFRFMLGMALAVIALAALLSVSRQEWALLLLSCALVLCTEGLNSALEHLTDLASPQQHPLAKKAKDSAAGAALLASLFAAAVGLLIFGPKLWRLL